jgi:hypothetical protein
MPQQLKKRAAEPSAVTGIYQPRTALGRRLWSLRKRILASGEPPLTWDEIDREVAERRGEQ